MKYSQDVDFTGGGRPKNRLLKGFQGYLSFSQYIVNFKTRAKVKLQALTIGEFLISLAIIAVLAIILIPIIKNMKPDENEALHNKAAYIVNRIVNELSSDDYLYPNTASKSGLNNLVAVKFNGEIHEKETKFCTLFATRINKAPGSKVNCSPGQVSVTSIEGFDWYLPIASFDGNQMITVDVNGDQAPNCSASLRCMKPDRFNFQIAPGIRVPVKEIGLLAPTQNPPARPGVGVPPTPADEKKTGLESYRIECNANNATIYGDGDKKVNGNYMLVAIPKKGFKCNWFVKQITVKDANVNDCGLSCSPDNARPQADGENIIPPPTGDDDDDEEDKTYCIIAEVTGDPNGCKVTGDDCGLTSGKNYIVTVKPENGFIASWETKDVYIKDKDETVSVECSPEEVEECFNLKFTGDLENCPVTAPDANCKKENGKYRKGKHTYTITPKDSWSYKDSADPTSEEILITDKDEEVKIECKEKLLPPVVDIHIDDKFDGLWQDNFGTPNVYYHVYAKRYWDTRTLRVETPDVYVKLKITGKYVGETQYCPVDRGGSCSFTPLTLNEDGIEAKFRQALTQELANGASTRWESYEELGLGGHSGSKLIKTQWEKYTLTINDKVYAENKAWPTSANAVEEFKDEELNTTFKLHFNSIPRYMYQFVSVDMAENTVTEYDGFTSYAWIDAKTNVVACASGNCSAGAGGIPGGLYTYFEPNAPHLAHKGERIHVTSGSPFKSCDENKWHFPIGVYMNGSQVCSPPNWSNQAWFECDVSISGGSTFPSLNKIYVKFSSCPASDYGQSCDGGNPSFPYNGSSCR